MIPHAPPALARLPLPNLPRCRTPHAARQAPALCLAAARPAALVAPGARAPRAQASAVRGRSRAAARRQGGRQEQDCTPSMQAGCTAAGLCSVHARTRHAQ
ncbi:hypothetical protein GQ55_5G276300 [Panicum hallii var. hallii]|uniref:Uncharacterized protein n=1 Tax=Panicum hallii var. hallii TaxID=1504633 RepID=A0A2T7DKT2_9POAL|nr:hypothetical protein GQ55_5G276300 [Panicum hallii var. hallii]